MKTLEYPLPSSTLTPKDCTKILWPALKVALPQSKLQRRFPRALLYAPSSAMGIGLPSLYVTQLYHHIAVMLNHGHSDSTTGRLLRSSMELLRLELGTDHFPLNLPWSHWGHLATPTWLTSTWEALSTYDMSISDTTESPTPLRLNDVPIMDHLQTVLSNPNITRRINHCRQVLRLFWLSELFTARGDKLDPTLLNGTPSVNCINRCHWPRQGNPNAADWRLWKMTILSVLCHQPHLPNPTTHPNLGPFRRHWADPRDNHYLWKSLWDPKADRVYHRSSDTDWSLWIRLPKRSRISMYHPTSDPGDVSPRLQCVRATIQFTSPHRLWLLSTETEPPHCSTLPQANPPTPLPLHPPPPTAERQAFIGAQPSEIRWPVQHLTFASRTTLPPYSLRNGTLKAVSDGSWRNPHGSAAFLLGDLRFPTTIFARGAHLVPPAHPLPNRGSAYRSELSGLLGILRFVHLTDRLYKPSTGAVTIACDSLSALSQVFGHHPLSHCQPNHDILTQARDIIQMLPHITFTHRHVRGHQDDHLPHHQLDHWAAWNMQADILAKNMLRHSYTDDLLPFP